MQFNHRIVGYLLLALAIAAWLRSRRSALGHVRGAFAAMLAMLVLQVVLGVVAVLARRRCHWRCCTSSGRSPPSR